MSERLTFHICETERGWVGLILSPHGLRGTTLLRATRDEVLREVIEAGATAEASDADLADIPERISALASGQYANLAIHVDWNGVTGFRRAVMEEVMRIPAGQTLSYGAVAERVGYPRAARAVGRVMATNPLPLVVPCHRVVGSNGSLTGYGGGLHVKEALLRAEGAL
ncbi:MAG TPA: MGMT family protein [Dehalococcoidia bacterium]|jgi:methylated-DNA-[protein]-cysteine S-methyltransferase|nr:MGMT family protein [Dehalococcoidia bacterium]